MAHAHDHGNETTYYVEQIFTIAACAALGGVCVTLYATGAIYNILKEDQHLRVLCGGIGLLILVLIRATYVWIAAGKNPATAVLTPHQDHATEHSHNHGDHVHCDHQNDHAHGQHDHGSHPEPAVPALAHEDHGHDHDHGWAPWRYALLLLPVVLFLLGLPRGGLNAESISGIDAGVGGRGLLSGKGEDFTIGFNQLEMAARNPDTRSILNGKTVRLNGQYRGDRPDRFTLVRFKISCCAADAIPLKAVIMIDPAKANKCKVDPDKYRGKWVQVTGQLQFGTMPNSNEAIPIILLAPESQSQLENELVKEVPPDRNPYASD